METFAQHHNILRVNEKDKFDFSQNRVPRFFLLLSFHLSFPMHSALTHQPSLHIVTSPYCKPDPSSYDAHWCFWWPSTFPLLNRCLHPPRFPSAQGPEAKKIVRNYNKIAKILLEYEILYHRAWMRQVETATVGLHASLLVRHPETGKR